jgi:hypothetical protein
MTDETPPEPDAEPEPEPEPVQPEPPVQPEFTKEPQPELPLADRRRKAGITKNRIGLWIVVCGFALYMIITGIVGIVTKAR